MRMPFNAPAPSNLAAVIEQLRLLGSADQPARQRPRLNATLLIEFAELRHRLLNDTTTDTHAAHQAPVAMNLPVLLRIVWRRYMRHQIQLVASRKYPRSALHAQISPVAPTNQLIRFQPDSAKSKKTALQLRKLG